jgi:hypothetical protein
MTAKLRRLRVALNRPEKVPELIVFARAVVQAMSGNRWFPAPVPSMSTVQAAIDKLGAAEAAALSRTHGLIEVREDARNALIKRLAQLKACVETVADENPDDAASIIESAGMSVAGRGLTAKAVLAVYSGRVSGSVRLAAKAAAKVATYEWHVREEGAQTWKDLPATLQARTTVGGLLPGRTYSFRFRATTRRGVTEWCDPVSYVVQ